MSTYYYGTLYKKRKENWSIVEKNLDMNCVKNFINGWEIEADSVYNVEDELKKLSTETDYFYTYTFIGCIDKSIFEKSNINCDKFIKQGEEYLLYKGTTLTVGDSIPLVYHDEDLEQLRSIIEYVSKDTNVSFNEWSKLSDEEKINEANKYFNVYIKLKNYYKGNFYGYNSFDKIIKISKEKLKEIEENKRKWENTKSSLEYLKLSDEEKENVWKSFEYEIEDEDDYYKYKLQSAEK